MRFRSLLLVLLPAALILTGAVQFPEGSPIEQAVELFPASPAVNDQRGFAIAADGNWLAVGARLEDLDADLNNEGAVHLFRFDINAGIWRWMESVTSDRPEKEGQFGFAVALSGGTLAVGALGEGKVHVFTVHNNKWIWQTSLSESGRPGRFGRSVSIHGDWLAVGEVDPHGEGEPGAVHLFQGHGAEWTGLSTLEGDPVQPDERFGHSVALRGEILAVGAPGANRSRGIVYLFELRSNKWVQVARTAPRNAAAGDQVGFSVATDGEHVAVGAPTVGEDDSGAVWLLRQEGEGVWRWRRLPGTGGQLGHAVTIEGGLIAAGAPFGGGDFYGSIHVFAKTDNTWSALDQVEADNADPFDLSGSSVAISGDWVLAGAILGDQGGNAAGSISSFLCKLGEKCQAKGDVVVAGDAAQEVFGISVAAISDAFAVGARRDNPADPRGGSVYVFRRASQGWRQEVRLTSVANSANEFGAAMAFVEDAEAGDLLVVGDPRGTSLFVGGVPGPFEGGGVYLFRRKNGAWEHEARLSAPFPVPDDRFGRSVATDGRTIVVGAGGETGTAYVFEEKDGKWSEGVNLFAGIALQEGDEVGYAVSVQGDRIVVGAPFTNNHRGAVHMFKREKQAWAWRNPPLTTGTKSQSEFGFAVLVDGNTIFAGAPRHAYDGPFYSGYIDAGAVYMFGSEFGSEKSWLLSHQIRNQAFGSAIAVRGTNLVVGAPAFVWRTNDADEVFLFQHKESWLQVANVNAITRPLIWDHFGSGVAIGDGFFVVTNPGETGGDRVTVFELRSETEEETP